MRPLWILATLALGVNVIRADDRAREEAAEAEKLCLAELHTWKVIDGGVALDSPREPVVRWTNPAAGRVYGNTYVWLHQGRPVAAGSMYRYFEPYRSFNGEFVALTGNKLTAQRNQELKWRPEGTWAWHTLNGVAVPAATAAQRLIQMRALAGEFAVEMLDTRNIPKGDAQTPRLLPRPLVRYDMEKAKGLDGALFAFVIGTDPELLLLIECDTLGASPTWRFGAGRMNRDAIRIKRRGETVWEVARLQKNTLDNSYWWFDIGLPRKESRP